MFPPCLVPASRCVEVFRMHLLSGLLGFLERLRSFLVDIFEEKHSSDKLGMSVPSHLGHCKIRSNSTFRAPTCNIPQTKF